MAILTLPQTNSLTTLETGALAEYIATRACRRFLPTTHSFTQRLQKPFAAINPDSPNSDFLSLLTTLARRGASRLSEAEERRSPKAKRLRQKHMFAGKTSEGVCLVSQR